MALPIVGIDRRALIGELGVRGNAGIGAIPKLRLIRV